MLLSFSTGPDGVVVILWDCGSQEPGSNPGPGPKFSFSVKIYVWVIE